ncbi:MAG TPA: NAD-dependent succinate-semialdehyde dehydrogenase [Chthoniobacterales bacterium]|jgi:succinate-semialdehyde dehydrogenase/glutarate-semialdehyde dehydrogenase|nr:NAD-dependent succinate-semialdehyde dehydrogenase [Chthoniobacterales bacterium]
MAIASTNPTTGETLKEFSAIDRGRVEQKLAKADNAFQSYRKTSFEQRADWLNAAADLLEADKPRLARIMTLEMGKLLSAAEAEIMKCAGGCRFYAENAERFLVEQKIETESAYNFVRYEPMGPILAIMPWNFPFWQVFRFAAPALMAGNVALLKHAANVPQCAVAIEDVFHRAGFPDGVFQTLLIETEQVRSVIEDLRVKAVTLTGSERAGSEVASAAARQIKKSVLELGGSDPFIVMPSADLAEAVQTGVAARIQNTGQSCIAAKRFILADKIYNDFMAGFVAKMRALKVGDPLDPATEIGPLASEAILDGVDEQVRKSIAAGAKLLTGGKRIDRAGFFYEPTVLSEIPSDSPAYREEIFGPVACCFRVEDSAEAIRIANDSSFGLGATAWTNDPAEKELFARELEAGMVFINSMVASDPRLPFGGAKRSGFGRELGAEGIREFVNIKTVSVARPNSR